MSDFILIQKQILKTLAQHAPDKDSLLRAIEEKYDPDPENKCIFMLMPSNTDKHPAAYAVDESVEWILIHILRNFIGKLCVHLPQEEQLQLMERLHYDLIFKFVCTVKILGKTLAGIAPNARKVLDAEAGDGKQATPESVKALVKSLWRQCEKAMENFGEKDAKEKNSGA